MVKQMKGKKRKEEGERGKEKERRIKDFDSGFSKRF